MTGPRSTPLRYDDVEVGMQLPTRSHQVRRVDLIKYCGASGDYNAIHWNERVARDAGLPDVVAHGMYTMAQAGRLVTDWVGDPGALEDYSVRFSAPVVVPDDDVGTTIEITGAVEDKLDRGRVAIGLTASSEATKVLTRSRAVVWLA